VGRADAGVLAARAARHQGSRARPCWVRTSSASWWTRASSRRPSACAPATTTSKARAPRREAQAELDQHMSEALPLVESEDLVLVRDSARGLRRTPGPHRAPSPQRRTRPR
jgi:hypothetical protein